MLNAKKRAASKSIEAALKGVKKELEFIPENF